MDMTSEGVGRESRLGRKPWMKLKLEALGKWDVLKGMGKRFE